MQRAQLVKKRVFWQSDRLLRKPQSQTNCACRRKEWEIEHHLPHSGSFTCIFPYLPCLASARLRHLSKNPKQNSSLWGALQFSQYSFLSRQVKFRREYPLIFSRNFPQYWWKTACENRTVFGSPLLIGTLRRSLCRKSKCLRNKHFYWLKS